MKKEYFIQYADNSSNVALPKDMYTSINIGIRDIDTEFLNTLVKNMHSFPVLFVLESVIFEYIEKVILENDIPLYKFMSDGIIVQVNSVQTLEVICNCTVALVLNGLSVFIFFGQGLSEVNLVPTRTWDKPVEFKNLEFEKVDTFIDVHEVGLTISSKDDKFNSPRKVTHYLSKSYSLDVESSDI